MIKKYLYYSIFLFLCFPLLQKWVNLVPIPPLKGDFSLAPRPLMSKKAWLNSEYQPQFQEFTEQHIGARDFLISLNNQLDYSLFRQCNASGIVMGTGGQLIEAEYIRAYLGGDYIGKRTIEKKLRRLKYVQQALKARNKDLILVFEPGKASFFPEEIPLSFYRQYPGKPSNFSEMVQTAQELGIQFIDYNSWFQQLKGKHPYPLYPKTGIHWSEYGMWFVADSLVHYLEHCRGIDLPEMVVDSFQLSNRARDCDYDAAHALNLLFRIKHPTYAYPVFRFPGAEGKQKIRLLCVGDSYYWNIYNTGLPFHLFDNQAFWYFNHLVYPESYHQELSAASLDLAKEIDKQDVILLMVTERFLSRLDWGFIDQAFELLAPELERDLPYVYESKIRHFGDWFDLLIDKAKKDQVPLEDRIRTDALYTLMLENKEKYLLFNGLSHYMQCIRADEAWLQGIKEKAREMHLDADTLVTREAKLLFNKEYPEIYRLYQEISYLSGQIRNDPAAMEKLRRNPYYLQEEEMIWQVAFARAAKGNQSLALMTW